MTDYCVQALIGNARFHVASAILMMTSAIMLLDIL